MNMRRQIVVVTDSYCSETGMSRARLSTLLFNAGARLDAIASGRDLNTGTFERAMQWLSDNWPPGLAWPADVERPAPKMEAAE